MIPDGKTKYRNVSRNDGVGFRGAHAPRVQWSAPSPTTIGGAATHFMLFSYLNDKGRAIGAYKPEAAK